MTTTYELGNMLRGFHRGEFDSDEEAWNELSDRFNRSYPSHNGRSVLMRKIVRVGRTAGGNAPPDTFYEELSKAMAEGGAKLVRIDPVFGRTANKEG